ncbi:FadR/GntR family transcriptional regulator [Pengzhenrongella sp.]|jgi:DNA-binding FadR family transcriptional regulator|uniref:FadR/GntR family transcriptional regulator n=1 Tax=Pengzhenrongella sp. TaxID=2888820 RepID=UPI002F9334C9
MNLSDSWTAGQAPIVRVSAAEAVFSALRQAIEAGELEVGTRLSSENSMAKQYGVSRSVIREALRSCDALGLTSTRTGRGTFVVSDHVARDLVLGGFSARHLAEARPHIEIPAAGLAATRRTEEDLEALRELMESMAGEDDPQIWVSLDANFHVAIAHASGNAVFEQIITTIRDAMANQSETINLITNRRPDSDAEHQAIFDSIKRGSQAESTEAMRRHLAAVGSAVETIIGDGADQDL